MDSPRGIYSDDSDNTDNDEEMKIALEISLTDVGGTTEAADLRRALEISLTDVASPPSEDLPPEDLGVTHSGHVSPESGGRPTKRRKISKKRVCDVCLSEVPLAKFHALGCGHTFCVKCIKKIIRFQTTVAKNNGSRVECKCPNCRSEFPTNTLD